MADNFVKQFLPVGPIWFESARQTFAANLSLNSLALISDSSKALIFMLLELTFSCEWFFAMSNFRHVKQKSITYINYLLQYLPFSKDEFWTVSPTKAVQIGQIIFDFVEMQHCFHRKRKLKEVVGLIPGSLVNLERVLALKSVHRGLQLSFLSHKLGPKNDWQKLLHSGVDQAH